MSEAPERILASLTACEDLWWEYSEELKKSMPDYVEYIRADLASPQVESGDVDEAFKEEWAKSRTFYDNEHISQRWFKAGHASARRNK